MFLPRKCRFLIYIPYQIGEILLITVRPFLEELDTVTPDFLSAFIVRMDQR